MQKELIYDKMNGFITEETLSLPEELPLIMNLLRGRSAVFCMRAYIGQDGTFVNGWERTRIVMWKLS